MRRLLALACVLSAAAGCFGKSKLSYDGTGPSTPTTPVVPGYPNACASSPINVPASALQRMTGAQYLNTEQSLFSQPSLTLTLEAGDTPTITQLEAQKINDAAAAAVATGGHHADVPCDITGAGSDTCAQGFIETFGQKAFRRPLSSDEQTWLMGVLHSTLNLTGLSSPVTFQEAIDVVAQVMIQSPQHLYISAQGVADATLPAGILRMTGYERATRLSYMLTNSTPDGALLAAASSGQLDTPDGMRAQAQRLLDAPTGHALVKSFASSYVGIDATTALPALEDLPKDAARFPYDNLALRQAMRTETEAFYDKVFFTPNGSFAEAMTSTDAYVNGPLATLYGLSNGPADATTFAWMSLDPTQRGGLFTRAAFLAENATQDFESPIRRGVHLFRLTLCQEVPPPPPNVNNVPPTPGQSGGQALSVRQQTELRTSPAFCSSCHAQFNPIGFTLGNYDAMGAWQLSESGSTPDGGTFSVPVDATATVASTDIAGTLTSGVGLSQKLATSAEAQDCMAQQWFTYAMGRGPAPEDACTVSSFSHAFEQSGDMHALVLDVVTSAPSQYVRQGP
jgi:hypothetical protein